VVLVEDDVADPVRFSNSHWPRTRLRFTPLLADAARPCRHLVGDRWHADETYVKVAGQWRYVYRAIDQFRAGH
jgi:transposase-like protein